MGWEGVWSAVDVEAAEWAARRFSAAALDLLWQSTLLLAAAWGLLRLWGGRAAVRSAVWTGAIGLLPLLPLVGGVWGQSGWTQVQSAAAADAERGLGVRALQAASVAIDGGQVWAPVAGVPPLHLPPGRWPLALVGVWAVVTTSLLLRLAHAWCGLVRLKVRSWEASAAQKEVFAACRRRIGLQRPVRLGISAQLGGPAVLGLWRPAVLLPAPLAPRLEGADLERVVLHELAHIHRRDDWGMALQQLVGAFLWFLPARWWMDRQLDLEREIACDEWAVHMGGGRRQYAGCLLRLVEWAQDTGPAAGIAAVRGKGQLRRRLERILANRRPQPRLGWLQGVAGLAAVLGIVGALGALGGLVMPADGSGPGRVLAQLQQALTRGDAALYAGLLDRDFLFIQTDCHGQPVQYVRRRQELRLVTGHQGIFARVGAVGFDFEVERVSAEAGAEHPGAYAGDPLGHPDEDWTVFEGRARLQWPQAGGELLQEMTFKLRRHTPQRWKIVRWHSALPANACAEELTAWHGPLSTDG